MRLMSKLLMWVFVVQAAVVGTSHFAQADGLTCSQDIDIMRGGDLVPWPWGSEVRFPWTAIQGVWSPANGDCGSYFVFQVGGNSASGTERFVQVTQYDPNSCRKVATGGGFENSRVIYASMTTGTKSFDLTIRAFDTSILKGELSRRRGTTNYSQDSSMAPNSIIVLTMYPRHNWEKRVSYELMKLQSTPSLLCD